MDMPLLIAICEDQPEDAALLLDFVGKSGIPSSCTAFSCGGDLLDVFSPGRYDLIFLDIYMNGMRGIDAAVKIRERDGGVTLAFTTTSPDHTLESYRLGALKYLEKPVKAQDVRETMELAMSRRESIPRISLLAGGKMQYVPVDSILYLEQKNHTVFVHTMGGVIRTSQTVKLSQLEVLLPRPPFMRCHQSFIVNLRHVRFLDKELKTFDMADGGKVYIRRQEIRNAAKAYEDELFRAARGGKA